MEDAFRRVLDAGDIHRDQILGHLLPFASTPARVYMEHFGPQPKNSRHYIVYYANIIFQTSIHLRKVLRKENSRAGVTQKWEKKHKNDPYNLEYSIFRYISLSIVDTTLKLHKNISVWRRSFYFQTDKIEIITCVGGKSYILCACYICIYRVNVELFLY